MVYSYSGMILSSKKEWSIDTGDNVDEPLKHAKLKKPDSKGYILHDSIFMKYLE